MGQPEGAVIVPHTDLPPEHLEPSIRSAREHEGLGIGRQAPANTARGEGGSVSGDRLGAQTASFEPRSNLRAWPSERAFLIASSSRSARHGDQDLPQQKTYREWLNWQCASMRASTARRSLSRCA